METLRYRDGDTPLAGLIERPAGVAGSARRPGVLVVPEVTGLADHPKRRIKMLADLGYGRWRRTCTARASSPAGRTVTG
jgi:dienelactone hydrolase